MIIEELIENGERIRRYSNVGRYLVQGGTGNLYEEAVDPVSVNRSYTEGELIPDEAATADDIAEAILEAMT